MDTHAHHAPRPRAGRRRAPHLHRDGAPLRARLRRLGAPRDGPHRRGARRRARGARAAGRRRHRRLPAQPARTRRQADAARVRSGPTAAALGPERHYFAAARAVALASLALAPAVVLAMVAVAGASSLLTPVTPAPHSLPHGVARGRALALGRAALAELRTRTTAVVPDFPLGGDATVELELRRFEPFAPGARVEAVDGRGVRAVKLPDHVYFTGTVRGEPDSRVLLIAARDHVRGFVAARGTVYPFGPDRRGRHRSYALRDVDPTACPPPGAFCANDLHRDQVDSLLVSRSARVAAGLEPPPIVYTSSGLVQADAAIETDHELWARFGSDAQTLDYLASLAAASSAIDERDVSVRLSFSYIRLWPTASDPWSATL